MLRIQHIATNGKSRFDVQVDELPALLEDKSSITWVDFQAERDEVSEPILREIFHFHPLSIDDALQETHVPKVDDWEDHMYIVLHSAGMEHTKEDPLGTCELDTFLGENFVVTHHDQPIAAVDRVWDTCARDERNLKMGADHVLYRLTDELVVDYMMLIEELDERIEKLEDRIFWSPNTTAISDIFGLKRAIITLRRTLSPQREVLNRLARDEFAMIDRKDRVYFRDVYDHMVRMHDLTEGLRDMISGVLDTYLSVINNRMNEVMKTLTVITTLFMPLSFITGFFGMNFFAPDPSTPLYAWVTPTALVMALLLMGSVPVGMVLYMRRKAWM